MFFALMEGTGQIKYGLKISFGLIFLFLALRYNYGSDYTAYLELFHKINLNKEISVFDDYWKVETGWILLNRICAPIGFFGMTTILALLNCVVYYKFFKKYVPPKYYWVSVFLYIFDVSYMQIHLTAMRQSLAILIFLFSIDYLYKKDIIRYVLCIILASFFHFSSIILLPVFILGFINFKVSRKAGLVIILSYILLFVFSKDIFPQINLLVNLYFEKYSIYEGAAQIGSGLGLVLTSFLFFVLVYHAKYQDKENLLLFKIGILAFIVIPLGLLLQLLGRVGMYFHPALLVVYPIILSQIKNPLLKILFLLVIILLALYNFKLFFADPLWMKSVINYQTIFSAPQWY